ncbi:hypothetical protein RHSIM_Rhsim02G0218500 [Rhododendron simsii]|uniref:adenylate kinase n=1 Tax=Rhododendron simsii TaxID=118357 RepID=A0A834HAG0_RHOSS|nr:hypothetical protein RHSIM_Rhsim02G0218500 [Rhododendron simsii]
METMPTNLAIEGEMSVQNVHASNPKSKKVGQDANLEKDTPGNLPSENTIIFVLGGPGSGNGTLCSMIASHFGFHHLSAGDLLEEEVKSGSDIGSMIKSFKMDGKLVPAEIVIELLHKAMHKRKDGKFLIDGFPCNEENRVAAENMVRNSNLSSKILPTKTTMSFPSSVVILEKTSIAASGNTDTYVKLEAPNADALLKYQPSRDEVTDVLAKSSCSTEKITAIKGGHLDGKLVPAEIVIELLHKAMHKRKDGKFLIDGFPRNEENRVAAENMVRNSNLSSKILRTKTMSSPSSIVILKKTSIVAPRNTDTYVKLEAPNVDALLKYQPSRDEVTDVFVKSSCSTEEITAIKGVCLNLG